MAVRRVLASSWRSSGRSGGSSGGRFGGHFGGARPVPPWASSLAAACGVVACGRALPKCDEPECEETLNMGRRVVRGMSQNTRRTVEDDKAFRQKAQKTFKSFAGDDDTLSRDDVEAAVRMMTLGSADEGLPWELGPLLWRLMDIDHNERVTLKEFMIGQALLQAAAAHADFGHEDDPGNAIEELCWRALDVDGDGKVTKHELSVMVRLMLHLGAVDDEAMKDIKLEWAAKEVWHEKTGRGRSTTVPIEAIEYYMHQYDLDGNGFISREEFSKCNLLQHNFWLLLTKPEVKPIFLAGKATK